MDEHRRALQQQGSKGDRLGHTVVEGMLAAAHRRTLLQQFPDLGVNMKFVGIARQLFGDLPNPLARKAGIDLQQRFPRAADSGGKPRLCAIPPPRC